jgi:hypothetical protein
MSCKFDKDIIQKYVDNTIEPLELIVLKEHIAVCQDCRFELDLMNKLESSLHDYFGDLPNSKLLDEFGIKVLDKCYKGSKSKSIKAGISKVWRINKMAVSNASMYASYIPGSKLAANTAKKASKGINKALKNYMKNSFKKIITSL